MATNDFATALQPVTEKTCKAIATASMMNIAIQEVFGIPGLAALSRNQVLVLLTFAYLSQQQA